MVVALHGLERAGSRFAALVLLVLAVACGRKHSAEEDGQGRRGGSGGSGAAGSGGAAGKGTASGGRGGASDSGGGAGVDAGDGGSSAPGGDGGSSDAGAGGTSGGAGVGGGPMLGRRCVDCPTKCWDIALELPQPGETCTEPSPVSGMGIRFDLSVTLPSGEKRYLADSPYDYTTDSWPTYEEDSLGQRAYHVDLPCGTVWLAGTLGAGTAEPDSPTRITLRVEDIVYTTANPGASVTITTNQAVGARDDEDLGPMFDLHTVGTLKADDGSSLEIDGDMRNVTVGASARQTGRLTAHAEGIYMSTPNVFVFGDSVLRGPIYKNTYSFDVLALSLQGQPVTHPLAESVGAYVLFSDGSLLSASGGYGVALDASGSLKWRTTAFTGPGLKTGGASVLARPDGSACFVLAGSNKVGTVDPDPDQPAQLICVDSAGGPKWQASLYPIEEPLGATELADGTFVVNDRRSPNVVGIAADGSRRFAFAACTEEPNSQLPYFKEHTISRSADGGGLAQVGDDVIAFGADGKITWRSVAPLGDSEILVAEDGTLRVLADSYLLKLGADGSLVWKVPVGSIGELVGVTADGTSYVTGWGWSNYGMLTAVSDDGSIAWSQATTIGSFILAPNGDLYGFDKEVVELVAGDSSLAASAWPTLRGGPLRNGSP